MQWDILATILLTASIQSLFGVGVLLFGTPILLVLGYDFITALTILLPISLTINLLQVSKDYRHIQAPFYRHVLTLSIPCVVLCLLLVTKLKLNRANSPTLLARRFVIRLLQRGAGCNR